MLYRWKELELFTIQTLSNIITFIQFALSPLELISPESRTNNKQLIIEINKRFSSIIKFFASPLNFIRKYNNIIGPIRTMLSALIVNAFIIFLYSIFFLPSWRFLVFFMDIFIPEYFLFGIVFLSRKYDDEFKIAIILLIIGIVYFLIRIIFFILHYIKQENIKWYVNCANRISSVFLSRLKKNHESHDEITEDIHYQIDRNTAFIQFDEFHFSYKRRILDFIITFLIWLFLLVFVIFGWKKVLKNSYKGSQIEDISLISDMITCSLFGGMCLRLLINVVWLIKPFEAKIFRIFTILHKLAYKGMHFLAGVSMIPILGIALKASTKIAYDCGLLSYYDSKQNANSFIDYFMKKEGELCQPCSIYSIIMNRACFAACSINVSLPSFKFETANDATMLSASFDELYLIPIFIFDLFYLSLFVFGLRFVSKIALDVLVILPAPTQNIECKYQTLVNTLDSAALNNFRSYKYKHALYSFSFTESKLFVYFVTNITFCGIIRIIDFSWDPIFLSFIISFASFFIAASQFFTLPYISILHNFINAFSYSVSGISSFLVGLHLSYLFKMPQQLAIFLVIMIIATPILTALITPFFVKKDPLLVPTKFDLLRIQKWDKKLSQLISFRIKKSKAKKASKKYKNHENISQNEDEIHYNNDGILLEEEPSISVTYFEDDDEEERDHDLLVSNFKLIKLAPIQIQEKLNKIDHDEFKENVEKLWTQVNLSEVCFDKASNEMINSSNKLIDCICYKNLIRLFNISLIFSSACLGWCLSSGIERWHRILSDEGFKYYLRCNMQADGSYPAFGTY